MASTSVNNRSSMDCEAMEPISMNNRSSKDCGGVERSSTNKRGSKDRLKEWVLQVENSLKEPKEQPHCPSPDYPYPYRRVPKSLRKKNTDVFYTPQVISFGPYHFQLQMKEPISEAEVLKSQVARNVHCLLTKYLTDGLFEVVKFMLTQERIEKIYAERFSSSRMQTQERIEKIYAERFPFSLSREVLAWMMTRDACILVAILNTFSNKEDKTKAKESTGNEKQMRLLSIYHPLMNDFVKDMFKMENQLPFWVLDQIRKPLGVCPDDCFESALENLSPVEVSRKDRHRIKYNDEHHILYLLHEYIVDSPPTHVQHPSSSPSYPRANPPVAPLLFIGWVVGYVLILLILSPLLVILLGWFLIQLTREGYQNKAEEVYHVRTLEELGRRGVQFKNLESRGIGYINFEESTRTLYLPKFKVDDRSEVILRNLIAMEISEEKEEKPITRYVILMNDLLKTGRDVAFLRRLNIITNKLGSDMNVARLWNSVLVSTEMPVYKSIDDTAQKVNAFYRRQRWKVLWAQLMRRTSIPWLVVSYLGAICLLLLTIVQVSCLFLSCQIK